MSDQKTAIAIGKDPARMAEWCEYRDGIIREIEAGDVTELRLLALPGARMSLLTHCPRCGGKDLVHWSRRATSVEISCLDCHLAGEQGWYTVMIERE